ncbi:cytochrome P450 [Mucor mucedo]|uniref:cytochrome P450 n=1 Tax=Mucor mucedo TaxID=29922 RepID=UPI00221F8630|nr:cytochrome P450 [Mucor mucedo]KAI7889067.1 cytochrome P450 [Mucor mucedo]
MLKVVHSVTQETKCFSIATVVLLCVFYTRMTSEKKSDIPVPDSAFPYIGHLLSLGSLPSETISKWHEKYGPIIKMYMGAQTWISVDDPILAHKIFVTHGVETSYRPHSTYAYYYYSAQGKGIGFSQPGAGWKEVRSAVVSVMAPRQIERYTDMIQQQGQDLITQLEAITEKEGEVNPLKHLELYSLNVIFSACFGRAFRSVQDPEFITLIQLINKSLGFAGLQNDLPNFLPALSFMDRLTGIQGKMKNFITQQVNPAVKRFIQEAKKSDKPNIVNSLKENGYTFSEEEMNVLMFDLIGGGTDTIAVTLSWNIAIMCNYPQAQKQVTAEIGKFMEENGRLPQFKDRAQMPYSISVIKECMRFKPTTSFGIPHAVKKDVIVDGYTIPKDATVISNMESMHKNTGMYSDPDIFKPERFLNHTKTMQAAANGKLEERDHFVFGWGRRVCPAIHMAEVEVFSAFIRIFAHCSVEPSSDGMPDIDHVQNIGINLLPRPYKVRLVKRMTGMAPV